VRAAYRPDGSRALHDYRRRPAPVQVRRNDYEEMCARIDGRLPRSETGSADRSLADELWARSTVGIVMRARAEHLREGGVIHTRLLRGVSSYSGREWYGVRVWDRDVICFPSLAEAETAFDRMTVGQVELRPTKR
jgi:hypothetical protein